MHALRTRFKGEIVAEFLPPRKDTGKVIILCDGMPAVPSKNGLMEFWARKGYWVFHPRYRGTWESSGEFLEHSPHQDILDLISELPKGFTSFWDGRRFKVQPRKIILIASSFGGAVSLISALDNSIDKVIAFS